jgi:glucose-6-phosphate isomerase
MGKTADELRAEGCPEALVAHKTFPGNRPSLSLLMPSVDPFTVRNRTKKNEAK